VRLPNPDGKLRPGAYVQVALHDGANAAHSQLLVPGNALLFRKDGAELAVVGADGRVTLKKIDIAQDLGQQLVIEGGIEPTDKVIVNPSDSVADGDQVQIAPQTGAGKPASTTAAQGQKEAS
jgi:hypothetical protein